MNLYKKSSSTNSKFKIGFYDYRRKAICIYVWCGRKVKRELIREKILSVLKLAREKGRIGGKPKGLSEQAKSVVISTMIYV